MDIVVLFKVGLSRVGASPVMWLMLGLSIVSVAVILERALLFARVRADTGALARALEAKLRARDMEGARALLAASRSVEAAVVGAGLASPRAARTPCARRWPARRLLQRVRLERGLGFLGRSRATRRSSGCSAP